MGIGPGCGVEEAGLGSLVEVGAWVHAGVGGSAAVVGGEVGCAGAGIRLGAVRRSRAERVGDPGESAQYWRSVVVVVVVAVAAECDVVG